MNKFLVTGIAGLVSLGAAWAHGPGFHRHGVEEETPVAEEHTHISESGKSFKTLHDHESSERWWGASLTTGWESRHVHYGVDETGPTGAYTTELSLWVDRFTFGAWSGFGTGNEFEEWNFTAAYVAELGPVFFVPGYNFRYTPGFAHDHGSHDDHDDHGHDDHDDHDDHGDDEHGHVDRTYRHEIFFVLGTDIIPYVTPSYVFVADLNYLPGVFMEFRLDGDIPLYKDIVTLEPYALLGINAGYNTREAYGWNNFQFGTNLNVNLTENISVFGGINYSIAMSVLREIGEPNVVWANCGITLAY